MNNLLYKASPVAQTIGDISYEAQMNLATNKASFLERIPSLGVLTTGELKKGSKHSWDLGALGIESPMQLVSVWALTNHETVDEVRFRIYRKQASGNDLLMSANRFNSNEMPVSFPPGGILQSIHRIEVQPSVDTTNVLVILQPANIMFYHTPESLQENVVPIAA